MLGTGCRKRNGHVVDDRIVFDVCPAIGRQAHRTVRQTLIDLCKFTRRGNCQKPLVPAACDMETCCRQDAVNEWPPENAHLQRAERSTGRVEMESDLMLKLGHDRIGDRRQF